MARRGKIGKKTMRRRAKRSSRRLNGLGAAPAAHADSRKVAVSSAVSYFEKASLHAAEGRCGSALDALTNGSMWFGSARAHMESGGGTGGESRIEKLSKQAEGLVKGACLNPSKLSGLGRTRKSRKSRRSRR